VEDVRWIQRFEHFKQALGHLRDAVHLAARRPLSELEQQGLIKAFELTHELAWNTLKDFLTSRGAQNLYGSKDAVRAGFQAGLIADGQLWMDMIQDRNLTSHNYDEETAARILKAVREVYTPAFETLQATLEPLQRGDQEGAG
jgi:nucleotidyltransferase substrate binding protein (TIGR01987 family)